MTTQPTANAVQFSLANLPYGVATCAAHSQKALVTRIEDNVIFLDVLVDHGKLSDLPATTRQALKQSAINEFAALPKSEQLKTRQLLQKLLKDVAALPASSVVHINETEMHVPVGISDFTDFSCCEDHILNVSEVVLGARKMPPQFWHFPLAYSGRTSTIVVSGTDIPRPLGMHQNDPGAAAIFAPCSQLDYELEMACIVGKPSKYGSPISVEEADEHIFGFVLINDWSARDILRYESHPLGPINSKSFGTTMSPWIVTLEALKPFYAAAPPRFSPPAPYLQYAEEKDRRGYNVQLHAELIGSDASTTSICTARMDWAYWTFRDMVAHQTINGCSLRTGDMLGTGTISGKPLDGRGSLIEVSKGGKETITLENGETRSWLEDGDTVKVTGWAGESLNSGVGFGECVGRIVPPSASKFKYR